MNELTHAELVCGPDQVQRAEYVVPHRLLGAGLHQGHMLMGRGVEHHVGPVVGEQLPHPLAVPDGGDLHRQIQLFIINV